MRKTLHESTSLGDAHGAGNLFKLFTNVYNMQLPQKPYTRAKPFTFVYILVAEAVEPFTTIYTAIRQNNIQGYTEGAVC